VSTGRLAGRQHAWTRSDSLLTVSALLLFVDSFLHWERICVSVVPVAPICVNFWTAWSGKGAVTGAAMAITCAVLVAWQGAVAMIAAGAAPRWLVSSLGRRSDTRGAAISAGLATAIVVLGLVKMAFVVADHSTYGSYVAVVLLLLVAAGGAMKLREMTRRR
jgi:hypothetical protein